MAYAPATNLTTSPGLAHQATIINFQMRGMDILRKKTRFRSVCDKHTLQKGTGRTMQFYRMSNLASSSTQTIEGSPGTGLSLTNKVLAATVSQYSAYITLSDMLMATSPGDMLNEAVDQLSYMAALSTDNITRTVIDNENASTTMTAGGTYFKVNDLRAARASLQAADVPFFDSGKYKVFLHPNVFYDVVTDPAANGLADIAKYTYPKDSALIKTEDRGKVADIADCEVWEVNNVYTSAPTYRVYIFGKGGVGCVDLEGKGPSDVVDANREQFKINVFRNSGASVPDPEGLIAAGASYNFAYTTVVKDGPTGIGGVHRFKTFTPTSSLG